MQTLGSSYLIYLSVIAFILWIKVRLSCIKVLVQLKMY
jgi:hypothetical protein